MRLKAKVTFEVEMDPYDYYEDTYDELEQSAKSAAINALCDLEHNIDVEGFKAKILGQIVVEIDRA